MSLKKILIREDLNVPLKDGEIVNDERILRALPTIQAYLKEKDTAIILMSHLGRPKEGVVEPSFSLAPVAKRLSVLLGKTVRLIQAWQKPFDLKAGDVVLLENVRFNAGEKKNDPALAKAYAALGDVFVMDAFATSHRAEASTVGVSQFAKKAEAGPLLKSELAALTKAMDNPARPVVAIVGGSKVSTKIALLRSLLKKVDVLIVGGGIANTFLAAAGFPIGKSLYEPDWVNTAKTIWHEAEKNNVVLPLPVDVVVAKEMSNTAHPMIKTVEAVSDDDAIFDIGPVTATNYIQHLKKAGTIIWNGPVGVFEIDHFSHGTEQLAKAIAASKAYSLAGGGDTLAALAQFGIQDKISYISTGGGAFLAFLEGETLPAVAALTS